MKPDSKKVKYDLEERTFIFSKNVREFIRFIPRTLSNIEDSRQLIRSSGTIGANYIEANESLGQKDFLMKVKISRKEAKESIYWLKLLDTGSDENLSESKKILTQEATELMLILSSILRKSTKN
ncbi:MAG: four helix bundle protein [Minisyncoccia bacterium]